MRLWDQASALATATCGARYQICRRAISSAIATHTKGAASACWTKPARALRVDRQELAARAAAEQWKLRRMIDFCYHKACLRRFILNYFGDRKHITKCGTCSACAPEGQGQFASPRDEAKLAAGTLRVSGKAAAAKLPQASELDQFIIDHAPTGSELRAELRKRAQRSQAAQQHSGEGESRLARSRLNEEQRLL